MRALKEETTPTAPYAVMPRSARADGSAWPTPKIPSGASIAKKPVEGALAARRSEIDQEIAAENHIERGALRYSSTLPTSNFTSLRTSSLRTPAAVAGAEVFSRASRRATRGMRTRDRRRAFADSIALRLTSTPTISQLATAGFQPAERGSLAITSAG